MRSIRIRYRDCHYLLSCPTLTTNHQIIKFLDEFFPKLLKQIEKIGSVSKKDLSSYILGLENQNDLDEKELKKYALRYLTDLTRDVENEMGIKKPYIVRIKKMKSRYGSNSMQTHSISYQLDLIHFSKEIIRSVVVHELAHEFQRNHSNKFYDIVYQYCPSYWQLKRKLRNRIPS